MVNSVVKLKKFKRLYNQLLRANVKSTFGGETPADLSSLNQAKTT